MYFAHFRVRPVRRGRRAASHLDQITATRRARMRGCAVLVVLGFAFAVLGAAAPAQAHGIAGNRVFPGTLSFDDPAVMDEFTLTATSLKHARDGNDVVDDVISWDFARLLTPTVSLAVGSGFIYRDWGDLRRSGFDEVDVMIKTLLYQNDVHEIMISAGVAGGIGRSGALGVGANQFTTVLPGGFFGKGFGDLPNGLAWLRPFAVTGAVSVEIPTSGRSTALNYSVPAELTPAVLRTDTIMHWGLSLQYSTFYLTPLYRPAAARRAARSVHPIGGVRVRLANAVEAGGNHESGSRPCGRQVSGRDGSHRAAQQRRGAQRRRPGAAAPVHRRSDPEPVWPTGVRTVGLRLARRG
jgi:hypothetical protein